MPLALLADGLCRGMLADVSHGFQEAPRGGLL